MEIPLFFVSIPEDEIAIFTARTKKTVIMTERKRFQLLDLCIRVLLEWMLLKDELIRN